MSSKRYQDAQAPINQPINETPPAPEVRKVVPPQNPPQLYITAEDFFLGQALQGFIARGTDRVTAASSAIDYVRELKRLLKERGEN